MDIERLLLVEDNEVVAHAIQEALIERGIDVHLVHTGRESIGKLIHCEAQAVIIDLTLPDIDGLDIAEIIRRNWSDIPIILTSGYCEPAGAGALLNDGRTAFLQKPFEVDVLLAMIRARLLKPLNATVTHRPSPSAPADHRAR
ncbi:MAG: response regulator transcription factor [Thermoanaerobaculia bacterium]